MIRTYLEFEESRAMTITAIITLLIKILGSPALIAGLIAFLQKTIHP